MFDARNNLVAARSPTRCARTSARRSSTTVIPRNVRLSEAPSHGKPALLYDVALERRARLSAARRGVLLAGDRCGRALAAHRPPAEGPIDDHTSQRARPRHRRADPDAGRRRDGARGAAAPRRAVAPASSRSRAIDPNPDQPRRVFDRRGARAAWPTRSACTACCSPWSCAARASATSWSSASGAGARRSSPGSTTIPAVIAEVDRRRSPRGRAGRERPAPRPQPDRARDRVPRARRHAAPRRRRSGAASASTARRSPTTCGCSSCRARCQADVEGGAAHASVTPRRCSGRRAPSAAAQLRDRIVAGGALGARGRGDLAREPPRRRARERGARACAGADPDLANLVDMLRSRLQTQVRLRGSASRGRIEVELRRRRRADAPRRPDPGGAVRRRGRARRCSHRSVGAGATFEGLLTFRGSPGSRGA